MTALNNIYKCGICGNIVAVVHASSGELVCCGKPMLPCEANTTDGAQEKHVPVIEQTDAGIKVTVGSVAHPMEDKHYIEWIEVLADGKSCRQFLKPGMPPVATFTGFKPAAGLTAREYCNLHGLWKTA